MKSLDEIQRKTAVILEEAPKEIVNIPGRNEHTTPEGLTRSQMTPEQAALLIKLIKTYVERHRPDLAEADWDKIEKAGLGRVTFAWAGGVEPGQPHYYRVQGPTFVLEYDNTQNNANHVHTVWRDFDNDFGDDLLKKHYEESHAGK